MAQHWSDRFIEMAGQVPLHPGTRYDASGHFLPEQGNTVVAQVVPGSKTEAALVDLRAAMQALPFAHLFAFTAVLSYHMTAVEGVVETRRLASHWPNGLDPDQPVDAATAAMAARRSCRCRGSHG